MNCCCKESLELKIKKGESIGFAFSLSEDDIPVDLTSSQMVMEVRENIVDDGEYVISKTITTESDADDAGSIFDPKKGQFMFKINDTDIENMSTIKPYFVAIYQVTGDMRICISAENQYIAKFLVFNP